MWSKKFDRIDLDFTNKINGYVPQYDSDEDRLVLKPLPNGTGSGATNLDGLTDVDISSVTPEDGEVLTFESGVWKPKLASVNGSNAYVIELNRWGITQGIPEKPYVSDDYYMADDNITGINNALKYASDNGYSEVIFPKGEYAICFPQSIRTQPNMVINFSASKLKVIYDSDNRSPLDTRPVDSLVCEFGGTSILCTTPNTHIVNLRLIGDREDRSWINLADERRLENTIGIKLGGGSDKSSVKYCNVSHYMADAIFVSFDPYQGMPGIGQMEFGEIDTTGTLVTSADTKMIRTVNFISIPQGVESFAMIGLGYAPSTSIPSGLYNAYFYNEDGAFVYKQSNIRTRDKVVVPNGASKFKLSWIGDGTLDQGLLPNNPAYWAILIKHGISSDVLIEYNEIHRCHRGGIFLGANNVTIRKNHFHNTGYHGNTDIDGLPTFTDFTRYSITTEDHIGHNCKILDNVFENTRMAVAMRGEYNDISGNEFKNCTYSVVLYSQRHVTINKNVSYYAEMHCYEYDNHHRNWIITDNIFNYSTLSLPGTGTASTISNNAFANNSQAVIDIHVLNFSNNSFNNSFINIQNNDTVISNCAFTNGAHVDLYNMQQVYDKIIGCTFVNSYVLGQSSTELIVKKSFFKDSTIRFAVGNMSFRLENCEVRNTTNSIMSHPTYAGLGRMGHTLELVKCSISLGRNAIINANDWGTLRILDCNINFDITSDFTTGLVTTNNVTELLEIINSTITTSNAQVSQNVNTTKEIIVSGSDLINFSLTTPSVQIQSDLMNSIPIGGKYNVAQQVLNATPSSGSNLGWICIVEGYANDNAWTQTKAYAVGQRVHANGNVYQCKVAGTSSTVTPSHTSGEAVDGTITWVYLGNKAVFKSFGLISE
ncbi:right-handed parallel beta-helix repeat-containing protein [Metabacillus arenae]|uniref:Right handed beta helix domain-containing protein n=1 Tax=Metabacillus arenae TaxID=2771434 RepID=A0A926NE99_9BACI|nr:carbohydrate-binding protein [Metabacillus arenae]MBD1379245.1 hypothetical protein [Metabacillus arenae]